MKRAFPCLLMLALATSAASWPRRSVGALAAPRIIMFHGGVLDGRIYMTTLDENMQFMGATLEPAAVLPSALRQRPFVEAALFWFNPRWEPYAADTVLLRTLRPEWAQGARLYLGDRQNLPLFDYNSALANPGLRSIAAVGLEILKRHAVPVYADSPAR